VSIERARRELAEHADLVAGRRVLELGSGTGVCGILAAKLGAAQVCLFFFC
jgi:predicted nicotinamide N-methyase